MNVRSITYSRKHYLMISLVSNKGIYLLVQFKFNLSDLFYCMSQ